MVTEAVVLVLAPAPAESLSRIQLYDPINSSLPGSSSMGFSKQEY